MDQRRGTGARTYEDFDPAVEWKVGGHDQDVVEIALPGFRKEHVRVQVDNHGVLRATGERPARGGKWVRFRKDLRLPDNCNADSVRAKFEDEKLIITLPIVATDEDVTPAPSPVHEMPPSSSPRPSPRPYSEPRPSPPLPVQDTTLKPEPSPRPSPLPYFEPRPSPPLPAQDTTLKPEPSPRLSPPPYSEPRPFPPLPVQDTTLKPEPSPPPPPPSPPPPEPEVPRREIDISPPSPPRPPPHPPIEQEETKKKDSTLQEEVDEKKDDMELPSVTKAPMAKTATTMRELLVNIAAAVVVLVGIAISVWHTARSKQY